MSNESYVLVTAARNEEAYIETTLKAVVAQTRLPQSWVIVSDGSTDRTDAIVLEYARRCNFIRLLRRDESDVRGFSNQAVATNCGYDSIKNTDFDFVGFLDADISFGPTYYEQMIAHFAANSRLGIAGGRIVEQTGGRYEPRFGNAPDEVAGAIQFIRRRCYDETGGLIPLRWGGHDAVANAMARRNGWEVKSFSDLDVMHHRPTGTVGTTVRRARFRDGMQDYFMGYHVLFETGKCVRRISEPPYLIGSVLRLCGYLWPGITRQKRVVPPDFVDYMRQQQLKRLFRGTLER